MMPRSTVYDRVKRTGYMMGPAHKMGPAMDQMPEPEPGPSTAPDAAGSPPNLRDAGASPESCGDCGSFQGNRCLKFDADVTPNLVCDAYEPREEGNEAQVSTETAAPAV